MGCPQRDFGSDGSNPTGVGIDHTAANGNARRKTQLGGGFLTKCSDQLTGAEVVAILKHHQKKRDR